MTEYVEVRTEDGELVPFETDGYDGPVRAGRNWDRVQETLEQGVERARHVARAVAARVADMPPPRPDRVAVEIGLKAGLSGAFGIAKSSTEAHIKITVEWSRDTAPTPAPPEDGESKPAEDGVTEA
ncbi:CU044_2847 family protein [Saccharothrix xinjiangensis]|uniref:CU044_2847 family protein n=1 Tax=Saccharothrix xinjiangensis TaxID=204798 RepID=A0ABV9Y5D2_9PSEU